MNNSSQPVKVSGGFVFEYLELGYGHVCGVRVTGQGYCWGSNSRGALGNGTDSGTSVVPAPVVGNLSFKMISGGGHTCALDNKGGAYCWGSNFSGQLGNGSVNDTNVPVKVFGSR